jgi:CBS domain-containing protein
MGNEKSSPEVIILKCMTHQIISLNQGATAQEASKRMNKAGIKSILIKKNQDFVGILTETDLMFEILISGKDPKQTKVEAIMSKPLVSIDENETLNKARDLMKEKRYKHLPVSRHGKVVGMLSIKDLISFFVKNPSERLIHSEEA